MKAIIRAACVAGVLLGLFGIVPASAVTTLIYTGQPFIACFGLRPSDCETAQVTATVQTDLDIDQLENYSEHYEDEHGSPFYLVSISDGLGLTLTGSTEENSVSSNYTEVYFDTDGNITGWYILAHRWSYSPTNIDDGWAAHFSTGSSGDNAFCIALEDPMCDPHGGSTSAIGTWRIVPDGAAVPEPATWAMMLTGFGLIGAAMRTARRKMRLA